MGRLPLSPAMSNDKEDWKIDNLVEDKAGEWVKVMHLFCDLQVSCYTKRREVSESVSKVVGVTVELLDDVVVVSWLGAGNIVNLPIGKLMRQAASTRVEVISLTAKLPKYEEIHNKAGHERENYLKKVQVEAKTSKEYIVAERDSTRFCYLSVLRYFWRIFEAANERNADYTNTTT